MYFISCIIIIIIVSLLLSFMISYPIHEVGFFYVVKWHISRALSATYSALYIIVPLVVYLGSPVSEHLYTTTSLWLASYDVFNHSLRQSFLDFEAMAWRRHPIIAHVNFIIFKSISIVSVSYIWISLCCSWLNFNWVCIIDVKVKPI